jgi:hypothetical protein
MGFEWGLPIRHEEFEEELLNAIYLYVMVGVEMNVCSNGILKERGSRGENYIIPNAINSIINGLSTLGW